MMRLASALVLVLFALTAAWVWARSGSWALGIVLGALFTALWLVGHVAIADPLMNVIERRARRRYRRMIAEVEAEEPALVARARTGEAEALERVRHRLRYRIAGADTAYIAALLAPDDEHGR